MNKDECFSPAFRGWLQSYQLNSHSAAGICSSSWPHSHPPKGCLSLQLWDILALIHGSFLAVLFPLGSVLAYFCVCLLVPFSPFCVKIHVYVVGPPLSAWGQFNSSLEVFVLTKGLDCSQNTHLKPKRDQLSVEQTISTCLGRTGSQMCVLLVKALNENLQRLLFLNLHLKVKEVLKWGIAGK